MNCRPGCGACCIAPSISSPILGMPQGKPAGVPCIHLTAEFGCAIYGGQRRPKACIDFEPSPDICGALREEAMQRLAALEQATR